MTFLRSATDYEVQGGARDQKDGSRRWLVLGSTSPTTWSLERLDEWVTEMTAHGREHGPAQFDGWGVSVSAPPGSGRGRQGFWERFALGRRGR